MGQRRGGIWGGGVIGSGGGGRESGWAGTCARERGEGRVTLPPRGKWGATVNVSSAEKTLRG